MLGGLGISKAHALVKNDNGKVTIELIEKSKTFVNGELVSGVVELKSDDRIALGNNFFFRFVNPKAESKESKGPPTWSAFVLPRQFVFFADDNWWLCLPTGSRPLRSCRPSRVFGESSLWIPWSDQVLLTIVLLRGRAVCRRA